MHYELHWGNGEKKQSKDLEYLQKVTEHISGEWRIYKIIESGARKVSNEQRIFGPGGIRMVIDEMGRGIGVRQLAKKYQLTPEMLRKYIQQYKTQTKNENTV